MRSDFSARGKNVQVYSPYKEKTVTVQKILGKSGISKRQRRTQTVVDVMFSVQYNVKSERI